MSFRMFASITVIFCGLSLAAAAQAPPTPPAAPTPPAKLRSDKPVTPTPPAAPAPRVSKNINIRIDATVAESRGAQVIDKKVISLTCVDGSGGSVRSSQDVPFKTKGSDSFNYRNTPLNMDATVELRDDGRVWTQIIVEYRSVRSEDDESIPGGIRQSVAVVLQPGVPLMVAQSADPVGDRRVSLEVTATVLK